MIKVYTNTTAWPGWTQSRIREGAFEIHLKPEGGGQHTPASYWAYAPWAFCSEQHDSISFFSRATNINRGFPFSVCVGQRDIEYRIDPAVFLYFSIWIRNTENQHKIKSSNVAIFFIFSPIAKHKVDNHR